MLPATGGAGGGGKLGGRLTAAASAALAARSVLVHKLTTGNIVDCQNIAMAGTDVKNRNSDSATSSAQEHGRVPGRLRTRAKYDMSPHRPCDALTKSGDSKMAVRSANNLVHAPFVARNAVSAVRSLVSATSFLSNAALAAAMAAGVVAGVAVNTVNRDNGTGASSVSRVSGILKRAFNMYTGVSAYKRHGSGAAAGTACGAKSGATTRPGHRMRVVKPPSQFENRLDR